MELFLHRTTWRRIHLTDCSLFCYERVQWHLLCMKFPEKWDHWHPMSPRIHAPLAPRCDKYCFEVAPNANRGIHSRRKPRDCFCRQDLGDYLHFPGGDMFHNFNMHKLEHNTMGSRFTKTQNDGSRKEHKIMRCITLKFGGKRSTYIAHQRWTWIMELCSSYCHNPFNPFR